MPSQQFEFFLLRYVPDLVNEEFVNLGIVLLGAEAAHEEKDGHSGRVNGSEASSAAVKFAGVRFTHDWRRLQCMDPDADIEMLQALEGELVARLADVADREVLLKSLHDRFSNTLQISSTKVSSGESPEKEIELLASMYLEPQARRKPSRAQAGRHAIYRQMREAFTAEGVWELMRKRIPAAQYTHPGDPLKIDCGYRPNGIIRLFHAVSLATDPDAAKVLAFSYPSIAAGITRTEHAKTEMTAIVEDDLAHAGSSGHSTDDIATADSISFALHTLAQNQISVARVSELNAIAVRARAELRV